MPHVMLSPQYRHTLPSTIGRTETCDLFAHVTIIKIYNTVGPTVQFIDIRESGHECSICVFTTNINKDFNLFVYIVSPFNIIILRNDSSHK